MDGLIIDGDFWQILLWFFIYCFLGWIWESIYRTIRLRRIINSGFLVGPYIPIYGFGAMLFIVLMHFTTRPVELFFIGGSLACTLEYVTSWLLEIIFHARWWDYSTQICNIKGRICLSGFLGFGAAAVIMPYIQTQVGGITANIISPWLQIVDIFIALVILGDTITTCRGLVKFNKVLSRYQKEIDRHTASFLNFVRKGKRSFEMHFTRGRHRPRSVLTFIQRRTIMTFPNFDSTLYPDALKRVEALFATVNQKFKNTQYKPEMEKAQKAKAKRKHNTKKSDKKKPASS